MVRIEVLGPIQLVDDDGSDLQIGPRMRRLLAALVMADGAAVSTDRLTDAVWYGEPAPEGSTTLASNVTRLRRMLDGASIDRVGSGYALDVGGLAVDARRFEAVVSSNGHAAGVAAAPDRATDRAVRADALGAALGSWRGRAYDEFADEPWAHGEAHRLEELRADAAEELFDHLLALDRHGDVLDGVDEWIERHPLRWRFRSARMVALYRSGRQGEALRTFQDYRALLGDELGLEPNQTLIDLERRIAVGDDALRRPTADAGQPLRGYRLLEPLGEGAFSLVWRATQPSVGRTVAVKQIRAELANRPEFIRRFETEAHVVATLEHPHIVPLYDYWREPDSAYLVMRLLGGGTLDTRLVEGHLTLEDTTRLVTEVGSALATAHRSGIVHRDVKPANVFLDSDGHFYLGDFGIALETHNSDDPTAALSVGSPAYASPEQLRHEPVGPAADVHGLGIMVYEALTGDLPFPEATTRADLLHRQLNVPVPPLRQRRPDLPAALDEVVRTATAKDPLQRQADAGVFVEQFLAAVTGTPPPARVPSRTTTSVSLLADENPYKGLRPFGEGDADDFFGRDRLVDRLVDALSQPGAAGRLIAVVGPSGSGKSSVVRAGLLPRLRAGAVEGSERWYPTTMTPGPFPFEELEGALSRVAVRPGTGDVDWMGSGRSIAKAVKHALPDEDGDLLLVVDQFEELFTLCTDETMRARFLDAVTGAVTDPRSRLRVVLTLRADFWDRPLRYPEFGRLVDAGAVTVTALAADELEQAIVEPAHRAGAEFEPGLVSRIVADVTDQPGALPLMQFALTELYDRQVSGLLRVESYDAIGGVSGAVARHAEHLYEQADNDGRAAIRRMFGRLVSLGEGTEDTRRRARRSDLGDDPATAAVLTRFGEARLLSFDHEPISREPTVEVAHEALIREWPHLHGWLDDSRDELRALRHLGDAARAWDDRGRDDADLYRGHRLEQAGGLARHDAEVLRPVEAEFVAAGQALQAAEQAKERRSARRMRTALVAVAVVAVIALLAGTLAFVQQRRATDRAHEAEEAARDTETARVGATAVTLADTNPRVALLLAAEAHRRDATVDSLGALQGVLSRTGNLLGYFGEGRSYNWVDTSPALNRIYAASDTSIDIYDGDTHERIDEWSLPGGWPDGVMPFDQTQFLALALAPDGERLAFLDRDGVLWLVDGSGADEIARPGPGRSMAWSPDGAALAVGLATHRAQVLDVATGATIVEVETTPARTFAGLGLENVAPELEGTEERLYFPRGALVMFDAAGTLWTASGPVVRAFSSDGSMVSEQVVLLPLPRPEVWPTNVVPVAAADTAVFTSAQGTHSVADDEWTSILTPNEAGDTLLRIDATTLDGDMMVSLNTGNRLVLYDRSTGESFGDTIDTGFSSPTSVAAGPGPGQVVVASGQGLGTWSTRGDGLIRRAVPPEGLADFTLLKNGDMMRINDDGTVALRPREGDPDEDVPIAAPPGPWSTGGPMGSLISLWYDGFTEHVHDGATFEHLFDLPSVGTGAAIDPENRLYARGLVNLDEIASSSIYDVQVFDAATGAPVGPRLTALSEMFPEGTDTLDTAVNSMAFSADGSRLWATVGGGLVAWDTSTWEVVHSDRSAGIAIVHSAPVSGEMVTVDVDGTISIRDPQSLAVRRQIRGGDSSADQGSALTQSDDEEWLLSTDDRVPRLFHYPSGQQVGGAWTPDKIYPAWGYVGEDHLWLVTIPSADAGWLIWDIDPPTWYDIACRAVGRNLTLQEWEQYGPNDEPYAVTCPQYPPASDSSAT